MKLFTSTELSEMPDDFLAEGYTYYRRVVGRSGFNLSSDGTPYTEATFEYNTAQLELLYTEDELRNDSDLWRSVHAGQFTFDELDPWR